MSVLRGRRAVVAGAASGIGAAIIRRYALEGASVALVDRDADGIALVADGIRAAGSMVIPIQADLVMAADLERAVEGLGGIDVLVNCAGMG